MADPEPLKEVTADQVVAQKALKKLRRYAKAVGKQEDTDYVNRLRSGLRNLVDPPDEGETEEEDREADALLAVAERYSDTEEADPKELLAEIRAAFSDDNDSSKHLPDPVVGDAWDVEDPDREWLVDGWLPAAELALLSGPGNVGKSLLVLQLANALATSQEVPSWLPKGKKATAEAPALKSEEGVPVVMANWEDSAPEARHRRFRLHAFGDCKWADASDVKKHLHVLPMRGHGPTWGPGGTGHISVMGEVTKTGEALRRYCEAHKARLLVLDPVSLALAVEENSRPLVSVALESWAGWANDTGCAVLLTGHPSKVTEGEGSDYSGSTAWRGLVRSLWTLKPLKDPDPNAAETHAELILNKANYAKAGQILNLETHGRGAAWHFQSTGSVKRKGTGGGKEEVKPA